MWAMMEKLRMRLVSVMAPLLTTPRATFKWQSNALSPALISNRGPGEAIIEPGAEACSPAKCKFCRVDTQLARCFAYKYRDHTHKICIVRRLLFVPDLRN